MDQRKERDHSIKGLTAEVHRADIRSPELGRWHKLSGPLNLHLTEVDTSDAESCRRQIARDREPAPAAKIKYSAAIRDPLTQLTQPGRVLGLPAVLLLVAHRDGIV